MAGGGINWLIYRAYPEFRLSETNFTKTLMLNLKFAARALRRNPGFTLAAVLTLAIGIGANTSLFSTFSALVLHPLSFPQPDRLVRLWASNPAINLNAPEMSWQRYEFIRDHQRSLSSIAASAFTGYTVARNDQEPEQVNTVAVTESFLPTLGMAPVRGRNFSAEEELPEGPKVAMLSYEYWQRAFGGRDSAVGESIMLNGGFYTIVGITPRALGNPFSTVLLFVPRPFDLVSSEQLLNGTTFLQVTARLKPGVTLAQAASEITLLTANYRKAFPEKLDANIETPVITFADELVGNLRPTFYLLLGAVVSVMLIACANVSALFLGRLSARHREIAVRLALGGTPGQLLRQFLAESALFTAVATPLGVLLGWWSLSGIQEFAASQLPPGVNLRIDAATLSFTCGISVLSTLLVGLVPALQASRRNQRDALDEGARGSSGGVRSARIRSSLVVGEVTLSVVLLILSGLLLVSFVRLQSTPPGFNPSGVATALVSLPSTRYSSGPQQVQFFDQLIERLKAQPRVQQAALAIGAPMTGFQPRSSYAVWGRPVPSVGKRELASLYLVTDQYFATMEIPLRAGRGFDAHDDSKSPYRCIINESFAKRLFPGESAIGKILLRGPNADIKCEIIGLSADVKSAGLTAAPPDELYLSARQFPWRLMVLLVRTSGDPAKLRSLIQTTVAEVDRNQPVAEFATFDSLLSASLGTQRIAAWLAGILAAIALLLAVVGLYSVLAYTVTQRTIEIGIRMALGSQRWQVVALVLRGGLKPVALGLILGLVIATVASRLIQTLLFSIQPGDPLIYFGVTGVFVLIATLACLLPSLKASRIDPIVALRGE
jgi:predicted permease